MSFAHRAAAVALAAVAGLGAALAACGPATAPARPVMGNRVPGPAPGVLATGAYACRIDEGGYAYPPFRCVVSPRGDRLWLEKVEGSVRFRGWVTAADGGFAFDGELFCPWGDCTERVHSVFAADGAGGYRGQMGLQGGPSTITLTQVRGATGAYGGDGYGGDGYGGGGYGGGGYGGDAYGAPVIIDP